jgi:uncharacterized protein YndB with AHSA1/START domain
MRTQSFSQFIAAPPSVVFRTLVDLSLVAGWRTPTGMHAEVHRFESRAGGAFRVSLHDDAPDHTGKTAAPTDTYSGHFSEFVEHERLVEVLAFESPDPAMQTTMRIITTLSPVDGGTRLDATHEGLPDAVSDRDNAMGWRDSMQKLAALCAGAPPAP